MTLMYKNLLIATDGSELAQKAVDHGLRLAKALGAKVTVVTVTEAWTSMIYGEAVVYFPVEEYNASAAANAAKILAEASAMADKIGVAVTKLHVKDQHPAEGIVAAAKEQGNDLIVMASHGRRGLARLALGSQATSVVTHSPVPVLVCR
jgi:nucleotide-binding universal stress UspA family protein